MFCYYIETMIAVFDSSEETLHRTIIDLVIIRMLKKTSLKTIRNNINHRMTTRLQYSVVERLKHRTCTFWHTEEDDFTRFDTSSATESKIDEDISVAL
jgi:hypothetical protein